jgi:salicylate hydroxylase
VAELEHWNFEDRVTLLGDAAHTHGVAFAAGVGLAIDDAYALGLAFEHVFPPSVAIGAVPPTRIREVFALYEATRRPHTSKVLAVVHEARAKTADRLQNLFAGEPVTDEDFRHRLTHRGDPVWVNEHDVGAAFKKVLEERALGQATPNTQVEDQAQEQSRL